MIWLKNKRHNPKIQIHHPIINQILIPNPKCTISNRRNTRQKVLKMSSFGIHACVHLKTIYRATGHLLPGALLESVFYAFYPINVFHRIFLNIMNFPKSPLLHFVKVFIGIFINRIYQFSTKAHTTHSAHVTHSTTIII